MTDWTGLAQVVTALGLLVTAIFSGVATILAAKAKHQATEAKEQAIATHTAVNSRMDEFKRLFEQVFIQKGVAQEVEKQRIRETDTGGMALMKEATDTAAKLLADARQVALVNQGTNPIPVQVVGPGVDTPLKVIAEDK
jgi:Na+-transporting NADH:ubiquinone oxidoreductase subunit NqrC